MTDKPEGNLIYIDYDGMGINEKGQVVVAPELEASISSKLPASNLPPNMPVPEQAIAGMTPDKKYFGETAQGYDAKREQQPKWIAEQRIIEDMIDSYGDKLEILDIPCGTGRFFNEYQRLKNYHVTAMDISEDMIALATRKVKESGKLNFTFKKQDIRKLLITEVPEVDIAVCVRMTRWLSIDECKHVLWSLQSLCRRGIIFTIREDGEHARPWEQLSEALEDNWEVHRNEPGFEEAYRIIELRRCGIVPAGRRHIDDAVG